MRAIVSATSISRSWSTDLSRIGSLTTQTLPQGVCWHLFGRAAPLGLGGQGLQQPGHADDRHHALDVVGEHVECHLSSYLGQLLREKVRSPIATSA